MGIKTSRRHWWITWPAIHGKAVSNCFSGWDCKSLHFTPKRLFTAQLDPRVAAAPNPYGHHNKHHGVGHHSCFMQHSESCRPLTCLISGSMWSFPINNWITKSHLLQRVVLWRIINIKCNHAPYNEMLPCDLRPDIWKLDYLFQFSNREISLGNCLGNLTLCLQGVLRHE